MIRVAGFDCLLRSRMLDWFSQMLDFRRSSGERRARARW